MRSRTQGVHTIFDDETNIRARELISVLVLASEVCLTEPRVVALRLPHAAQALESGKELCVLIKKYPNTLSAVDPAVADCSPVEFDAHGPSRKPDP